MIVLPPDRAPTIASEFLALGALLHSNNCWVCVGKGTCGSFKTMIALVLNQCALTTCDSMWVWNLLLRWLSGGVTCADLDTTYGCNCAVCTGCSVPAPTTTTTPSGPFSSSTGPPTTTSNVDGAATNPDPETSSAGTIGGVVGALVAVVVIIVVIVVVVRKGRGKTRSISYNHRGSHHSRRAVTGLIDDGADGFGSPENNVGSYEGVTL